MAVLGNLIEQVRGVSYKPEDLHDTLNDHCVTLLRANNIKDGQLNLDDVIYVDRKRVSAKQFLKAGDILICASSGSKELVGKAAYVNHDLPMTFGAFCKVVRPKTECPKYIGHFFNSPRYRARIANSAAGANINNIRNEHIDVLELRWPNVDEQYNTVLVLDKVDEVLALRKEQLVKLDRLVKSRFIELFDGKYEMKPLAAVCEELFAGGDVKKDKSSDFRSDRYPYPIYTNGEKNNGLYGFTSIARVTKEAVTISGRGTIGFTCLRKEPFYPAVRLIVAIPKQEFVSGCYLQHFIQSKNYGGQGASIPQLTVPMIKDELIPVPPIVLQEQFAAFVEQTDKSKLTIQASLDKLELLKKSLMQQYFG